MITDDYPRRKTQGIVRDHEGRQPAVSAIPQGPYRRDHRCYSADSSFGVSNGGSQLGAVSALTGSDAWASGLVFTNGGGEGTLLLHWNGTAWTRVPAPSPSPGGATGGFQRPEK